MTIKIKINGLKCMQVQDGTKYKLLCTIVLSCVRSNGDYCIYLGLTLRKLKFYEIFIPSARLAFCAPCWYAHVGTI